MTSEQLVFAELLLVLGLTLGFGFQQLWSLRRGKEKDVQKSEDIDSGTRKLSD